MASVNNTMKKFNIRWGIVNSTEDEEALKDIGNITDFNP